MNLFTFAGRASTEFGIMVESSTTFDSAERDYETVEVQGRNGDLTIDRGRFKNLLIGYTCGIGMDFREMADELEAFLASKTGYQRLEDTYQPKYYRMARVKTAPKPEVVIRANMGKFEIVFDCKPQKFLKLGEETQTFTASGTIVNPTLFEALPLIRAYGTGTIAIGTETITLTKNTSYTDIDCDIQDAFRGATNCNGNIKLDSGSFPTLKPGNNGITFRGGITKLEIIPRWWTI